MSFDLDVGRFYSRLRKLQASFVKHQKNFWNGAKCLSIQRAGSDEETPYTRSVVLQQWLFGYELPDTIMLLKDDGNLWVCGTKKKCEFIRPAVGKDKDFTIHLLLRNKEDGNAENYATLLKHATSGGDDSTNATKVGVLMKERSMNKESGEKSIVQAYEGKLEENVEAKRIELVDATHGLALVMAVKDESERDLMKKSSVLSNKVMKHGFVKRLEDIIEEETKITHEAFSSEIEAIIEDPNKIKLNVPTDDVQPCYFPIIQSGGKYELKVSAQSTSDSLAHDIIVVSLGARYKLYCSNIARTFLVDPPKKVSKNYEVLLEVQEACLAAMQPGNPLKSVYKAAVNYLKKNGHEDLVDKLPKNLGFAQGLDFRDSTLLLSPKNSVTLRKGMVFCLSIGFQNLELTEPNLSNTPSNSPVKKLRNYALMVSDMVSITDKGAEVLTKMGKAITNVAYNVNDEDDEDEDDDDDADAKLARKLANETTNSNGDRRSKRLARDPNEVAEITEGIADRERRQIELMERRNEERVREIARQNSKKGGKRAEEDMAEELETYRSPRDYPGNVQPNQVKVDMANQCVLLPVFGNPIPFHISTIKNVVLPDPDNATLLRINFYTAGIALGKDAPANMAKLVQKYAPYASFIREMTFRSLDGNNLVAAFRQISELRKRARAKEIRETEEQNLVKQEKLVRTKNERVPRLSDLTMRPVFAGRKTQGNLEAHTNGLRFISTRGEVVDIMYNNIKYAIFQPCENEIMVLVHFHLKNAIMVGKKKHIDIQFFTEVVDASQAVDNGRRSMYDPDEMDDEQRERTLRKRLNSAFRDFCKKVDATAKKNNYELEFDIPYRDLGFTGNPHKEMVNVLPTLNCLVNLTETPFFVVDLDNVDHVHFERVTYMSKAFDIILINKDFTKMPWRVDMIPNGDKDAIQEWLTDMDITYTEGPMNLNWKSILNTAKDDDRFYMDTEDDEYTKKEAGWEILRMFGREDDDDDDDDEDDSEFGEESGSEEEELEEDEEEDYDSEEDEDDDFDADEELEEQGMDWDEMEEQAAAADKRVVRGGDRMEPSRNTSRNKRRGGGRDGGGRRQKQRRR